MNSLNKLFHLRVLLTSCRICFGYHRRPCTVAARSDFALPSCYLPPQNPDLLVSETSFVLSHNSATGYITPNSLSKAGLSWWYSKTQIGSVYQQLNDGARALDLRIKYTNRTIFQHGSVEILVDFETVIHDAVKWCRDNPDELVLVLPSHFDVSDDNRYTMMVEMEAIYSKYGLSHFACAEMYGLTVGEVTALAQLASGIGYLIVLDGQDGYSSCVKENYVENQIVTCYDSTMHLSCHHSNVPLERLTAYVLASANNEKTDDYSTLGPPASLKQYPLNEIQALWQVDMNAVTYGMRRISSILDDNRDSDLNKHMVNLIYSRAFRSISLFAVDQVALHGNAILSVLRTACGQSTMTECGQQVRKPRMWYVQMTAKKIVYVFLVGYSLTSIAVFMWKQRRRPSPIWNTLRARVFGTSRTGQFHRSVHEAPSEIK